MDTWNASVPAACVHFSIGNNSFYWRTLGTVD